jgi:hypothetical protein
MRISDRELESVAARAIMDQVFLGSLLGASGTGLLAALAGAFLGGLGNHFARTWDEGVAAAGGSLGAAFAGILLPRALGHCIQPVRWTLLWFLGGFVVTLIADTWIGRPFDWPFYRWALCSTLLAIPLGALYAPRNAEMAREALENPTGRTIVALAFILTGLLRLVSPQRLGVVLAGLLGGALGALLPAGIVGAVGGKLVNELFGSAGVFLVCGAVIGASGGAIGGWSAWVAQNRKDQVQEAQLERPNQPMK